MKKVITYQAPNGSSINLTPRQIAALEKAGQWPRNASGEYCTVSHGLHAGEPTCETNLVSDLLAVGRWTLDVGRWTVAIIDHTGQIETVGVSMRPSCLG